jgi:hypothetical protein
MADGHLGKCKECTKADTRAREAQNPLSVLRSRMSAWRKNPTRINTYRVVEAAKMAEVLVVPDACQMCGSISPHASDGRAWHAHHFDYRNPLAVVFLCMPCHGALGKLTRERRQERTRRPF